MATKKDGRRARGEVRREVYRLAAEAVARLDVVVPVADSEPLAQLASREHRRLTAWLRARGRGELRSPPGGVSVPR